MSASGHADRRLGRAAAILTFAGFLIAAGPSWAATYFAEPGGSINPFCDASTPCQLEHAVETVSGPGDKVIALPGTYSGSETGDPGPGNDGGINLVGEELRGPLIVGGPPGSEAVIINSTELPAIRVSTGGVLSDMRINSANGSSVQLVGAIVERIIARTTGIQAACSLAATPGAVLRDSVCWSDAVGVNVSGATGATGRMVNVTAIGGGDDPGIHLAGGDVGEHPGLSASSVIARGGSVLGAVDVLSTSQGAAFFDHSNYVTVSDTAGGGITAPGSGTNLTDDPQFTDPAGGNFRPLPSSPVIDEGDLTALDLGEFDVARDPRVQGGDADIGAYEFDQPCSRPTAGDAGAYAPLVLSHNPTAYWRLGEASGTVAADEVGSNDGTYVGGLTLGFRGAVFGDANTAVDLSPDARSKVITPLAHATFNSGSVRTFEGWACREQNKGFDVLFSGDKRFNSPGLWTDHSDLDRIWFDPRREGGSAPRFWDNALSMENRRGDPDLDEWFHWVLIFNDPANTAELYINSVSQGVRSVTEPYHSSPGNFQIGNYAQISEGWNGPIDEVAVYDYALPFNDICNHYAAATGGCN